MIQWKHPVALALSLLVGFSGCNSQDPSRSPRTEAATATTQPTADDLRRAVYYLASDQLEGRGIDTPGIDKAADYVRNRFVAAGLKRVPGQVDFFQPFTYSTATGVSKETGLQLNGTALKRGDDFTATSFSGEGTFDGDVVFVGYGITAPDRNYDDYAGIDVKGKVVLAFRYEPHDEKGKSRWEKDGWSKYAGLMEKAKAAADHGAVALMVVNPPTFHGPDTLVPFARQYPGAASPVEFLHVKRDAVQGLVTAGGTESLQELQEAIDKSGTPHSVALKDARAAGRVKIERRTKELKNVMAWLPGAGPHANEYIVVGSHYDHLGYGGPGSLAPSLHQIHNGADDNASGTATVLELADLLAARARNGRPLDRSVLFVTFTAEESGLIGSQRFVEKAPLPLKDAVAMLNFDMVGRLKNERLFIGGQGTAKIFDEVLKVADDGSPLQIANFGRGGFGPSDHTSFAMKKVPVLFFFTGLHADYHRPTDDADKINYAGMTQIVDLGTKVIEQLAAVEEKPQYVAAADAAAHAMGMPVSGSAGAGGTGGPRVTLGVVPDYAQDESVTGVRISGTSPGSPAEQAGLQAGDVVTGFGEKKIGNIYDLTDALGAAKAGDKVRIKVKREGKDVEVEATLAERK
jgi:hypothetical protein